MLDRRWWIPGLLTLSFGLMAIGVQNAAGQENPHTGEMQKRAIRITYFGGFTGFDANAFQTVRQVIGARVADGTLAHFMTESIGLEGGFQACIELNEYPTAPIEDVLAQLNSIRPSDEVTTYLLEEVTSCFGFSGENNSESEQTDSSI